MSGTARVLLRNTGNYATIDKEDFDLISSFGQWYENDAGYAIKKLTIDGKSTTIRMHTIVKNTPKGLVTDHINGDKLDNRKKNLRCVSQRINCWNREHNTWKHTKYDLPHGITFDKNRKKYVATRVMRRRFDTLEEAIKFTKESERLDYER